MLKSNKLFIWILFSILFELEKYAFFKIAFIAQINVHFVRKLLEDRENLFRDFWTLFGISFIYFTPSV